MSHYGANGLKIYCDNGLVAETDECPCICNKCPDFYYVDTAVIGDIPEFLPGDTPVYADLDAVLNAINLRTLSYFTRLYVNNSNLTHSVSAATNLYIIGVGTSSIEFNTDYCVDIGCCKNMSVSGIRLMRSNKYPNSFNAGIFCNCTIDILYKTVSRAATVITSLYSCDATISTSNGDNGIYGVSFPTPGVSLNFTYCGDSTLSITTGNGGYGDDAPNGTDEYLAGQSGAVGGKITGVFCSCSFSEIILGDGGSGGNGNNRVISSYYGGYVLAGIGGGGGSVGGCSLSFYGKNYIYSFVSGKPGDGGNGGDSLSTTYTWSIHSATGGNGGSISIYFLLEENAKLYIYSVSLQNAGDGGNGGSHTNSGGVDASGGNGGNGGDFKFYFVPSYPYIGEELHFTNTVYGANGGNGGNGGNGDGASGGNGGNGGGGNSFIYEPLSLFLINSTITTHNGGNGGTGGTPDGTGGTGGDGGNSYFTEIGLGVGGTGGTPGGINGTNGVYI